MAGQMSCRHILKAKCYECVAAIVTRMMTSVRPSETKVDYGQTVQDNDNGVRLSDVLGNLKIQCHDKKRDRSASSSTSQVFRQHSRMEFLLIGMTSVGCRRRCPSQIERLI